MRRISFLFPIGLYNRGFPGAAGVNARIRGQLLQLDDLIDGQGNVGGSGGLGHMAGLGHTDQRNGPLGDGPGDGDLGGRRGL